MDHIEQLRASRQRLVDAQDEERRKLERNLHDGAQQQLVALSVKLRLAESLAARDPEKTQTILGRPADRDQQAIEDLRDLARGIYPPLLADKGLVAALEAQARRSPIPTSVRRTASRGTRRRWRRPSTSARWRRSTTSRSTRARATPRCDWRSRTAISTFEVSDDGAGFDTDRTSYGTGLRGMADRIEVIGGALEVRSAPGTGTSISGRIPTGAPPSQP